LTDEETDIDALACAHICLCWKDSARGRSASCNNEYKITSGRSYRL